MSRTFALLASAVLLAIVAGCSSNPTPAEQGMPCNQCDNGYVPVKHTVDRRVWCIQDGKMLDCKKNPAECPECRKALHQETRPPAD
jgi:hypothetical protein